MSFAINICYFDENGSAKDFANEMIETGLVDKPHKEHNVTFEPSYRNNWHIHHAKSGGGQALSCVDDEGWHQEWDDATNSPKPARSLKPGDTVSIPANVKHWHGAKKDSYFSHIAIEVPGEETSNEWCEPVTDKEYNQL